MQQQPNVVSLLLANQPSIAISPFQPAAVTVVIPWLLPPGAIVLPAFARYEAAYAAPVAHLSPDGRSDLPWLLTGAPLVRPQTIIQSSLALNPTTPAAGLVVFPWLVTGLPLVLAPPQVQSVYAAPVTVPAAATVTLPWLLTGLPPVSIPVIIRSIAAAPVSPPAAATVTIPWLMATQPAWPLPPSAPPQFALPLPPTTMFWLPQPVQVVLPPVDVKSVIVVPRAPIMPAWWPPPVQLTRQLVGVQSVLAIPHPGWQGLGWWPKLQDGVRLVLLVSNGFVAPVAHISPDGRSNIPWLPQAPPGKAKPVATPNILAQPVMRIITAAEVIDILGSYQTFIDVVGSPTTTLDFSGTYVVVIDIIGERD